MSSSSSGESFALLVRRSLEELRFAAPDSYAEIVASLEGTTLEVELDGSTVRVRAEGDELRFGGDDHPTVVISSSRDTVAGVLRGERTLAEAVDDGRLRAIGPISSLLRAHDALVLFVHARSRHRATSRRLIEGTTRWSA